MHIMEEASVKKTRISATKAKNNISSFMMVLDRQPLPSRTRILLTR